MRLYLIRHAEAVPHGTPGYAQDEQRPLTKQGQQQAADVARGLKRLEAPIQVIVTSPYVRAVETAQIVRRTFDERVPLKEMPEMRAEAEPKATSSALKALATAGHVALVGHEPHLSAWLSLLVTGREGALRCQFKKAGVACVEVARVPPAPGSGTLRWFLTPKQLCLISRTS